MLSGGSNLTPPNLPASTMTRIVQLLRCIYLMMNLGLLLVSFVAGSCFHERVRLLLQWREFMVERRVLSSGGLLLASLTDKAPPNPQTLPPSLTLEHSLVSKEVCKRIEAWEEELPRLHFQGVFGLLVGTTISLPSVQWSDVRFLWPLLTFLTPTHRAAKSLRASVTEYMRDGDLSASLEAYGFNPNLAKNPQALPLARLLHQLRQVVRDDVVGDWSSNRSECAVYVLEASKRVLVSFYHHNLRFPDFGSPKNMQELHRMLCDQCTELLRTPVEEDAGHISYTEGLAILSLLIADIANFSECSAARVLFVSAVERFPSERRRILHASRRFKYHRM